MTIEFYQNNANEFFNGTVDVDMSNVYQHFIKHLPLNSLVLDAGCGSGRDTKAFLEMGYSVDAFDASSELVKRARAFTGIDVKQMYFNDVDGVNKYEGIWCCASLLHVPEVELLNTIVKLTTALKLGGVWYVSFKYGDSERSKDGRNFTDMNEGKLDLLVENIYNLVINKTWVTEDNRPDRNEKWLNAILVKD